MSLPGCRNGCENRAIHMMKVGGGMMGRSMATANVSERFTALDIRITGWLARHGVAILRVGLGAVFL
jgi:hypothetical protein